MLRVVEVDGLNLSVKEARMEAVEIANLSVKKFRSMIRKKCHRKDFKAFQIFQDGNFEKIKKTTNGERLNPAYRILSQITVQCSAMTWHRESHQNEQ